MLRAPNTVLTPHLGYVTRETYDVYFSQALEDIEKIVWAEIAKLQAEGPTAQEVEASKALSLTRQISGLQGLGGFGGIADALNEYNQYTGDPGYLPKDIAATQAVTVASAKAAATKAAATAKAAAAQRTAAAAKLAA